MRDPHDKLAAPRALKMDVLIDGPLVAGLCAAHFCWIGVFFFHERGWKICVGRITQQIEGRWLQFVIGSKADLAVSSADVEAIEVGEIVPFAIHCNASSAANVQRAQLAALGKVAGFQSIIGWQWQGRGFGRGKSHYGAVEVNIRKLNRSGPVKVFKQKTLAQLSGSHAWISNGIGKQVHLHECVLCGKKLINVLEAVSAARECIPCRPQNCHKVVEVSFHLCTRYIAMGLQAQLQRPCRILLLQAGRSLSTSILRQREALARWCRSLS